MNKRSALTFLFSTAMVLGVGSAAGAQQAEPCPASPQPCALAAAPQAAPNAPVPAVAAPAVAAPAVAAPAVAAAPLNQTLPVTGSETAALVIGGTLLVAAGGALVLRSNKAAA